MWVVYCKQWRNYKQDNNNDDNADNNNADNNDDNNNGKQLLWNSKAYSCPKTQCYKQSTGVPTEYNQNVRATQNQINHRREHHLTILSKIFSTQVK